MAKKKQSSAGDVATGVTLTGDVATGVTVTGDINALIHDHSLFFDRLVELIPAKFYLPTDDKEKVWFQGLSKSAKAKAKKKTAENTKKARRNRLDPETSSKTTLDLLKESLEKEKSENDSSDDDDEENGGRTPDGGADGATYEELRQKLRRKIEELRSGRGGSEIDIERRAEKEEKRKRKREEWFKKKRKEDQEGKFEKDVSAAAEGIEFGKVKLGDDDWETDKKSHKKRKMSKEEELERARKLAEAKKDPEKGKAVTWQAATSRAMGVKVHDNPRLLKESIQREKRKHKKSVEKWKDRVKSTENLKKEKQDKRKGNIQSNIDKKKQKKIERREKKLMKRPGFEGRKDGYINGQK